MIRVKRVYEAPEPGDGERILVDRLWPRGLSKERARIDLWARDLAPSTELRRWFDHDPEKWPELQARYAFELEAQEDKVADLRRRVAAGTVTLVYASKEEVYNNAMALKAILEANT